MRPATYKRCCSKNRLKRDGRLIAEGMAFMELSAQGFNLTEHHTKAAIATVHARAARWEDTGWETIVSLYDKLLAVRPSPIVALNRAVALRNLRGRIEGWTKWAHQQ